MPDTKSYSYNLEKLMAPVRFWAMWVAQEVRIARASWAPGSNLATATAFYRQNHAHAEAIHFRLALASQGFHLLRHVAIADIIFAERSYR